MKTTKIVMTVSSSKTIVDMWGSWARSKGLVANDGSGVRRKLAL